ncbi:hypothetical protein RFI_33842, partial [Reticulomyxa filosa]
GSGLLYFWKLLHSPSLSQLSYIHQMMFHMCCLDVCKADTESQFLPFQLRDCHKNLIDSFKSFLIGCINFDKNKHNEDYMTSYGSFDNVIRPYLSKLQDILTHPDIWLYFIDRKKLEKLNKTVIQQHRVIFLDILKAIASKMSETQIDDALEFLLDKFHDKDEHDHWNRVQLIEEISWKMNEKQLGDALRYFIDMHDNKIHICKLCKRIVPALVVKLDKQMDYVLEYIISKLNTENKGRFTSWTIALKTILGLDKIFKYLLNLLKSENKSFRQPLADLIEEILLNSNETQQNNIFQCLIDGLQDKQNVVHQYCVQLIKTFSKKLSQGQLSVAFKYFMDRLLDSVNKSVYWLHWGLQQISVKLNNTHSDITFKYLMKGLRYKRQCIRKLCINLLITVPTKWNQTQLNEFCINLLKNASKYKNERVRYSCAQAIQKLLLLQLKWNKKQLSDGVFNYLIERLKNDPSKNVQYSCAESIGKISVKLDKEQLNIAWTCLKDKLSDKNEDMLVRMSCAESLGRIAMELDKQQLKDTLECLMNGVNDDNENTFVQKYCAYSLERILLKLNKEDTSKLIHMFSIQSLEAILMKCKEKLFDNIIFCLIDELKDEDQDIRSHCLESLVNLLTKLNKKQLDAENYSYEERIVSRLNETQLNNLLQCLIKDYKDKQFRNSCLKILGTISSKLNDQQLDNIIQFLKSGFSSTDYSIRHSCEETLQIISAKLDKRQINDIFEFLLSGLNNKSDNVRVSCTKGLEIIVLKLNETQLNHLLNWSKNNFEDTSCWVRSFCRQIFGIMFVQLNEQQKDNLFEFLSNGLNNKSGDILQSYSDTLQKIVLQLTKTQLNKLFDYLLNKLNTMNNEVNIEKSLSELNRLDPDDFFMWSTKNKDYDSYIRVLRKIVLQLDETKLDELLQFLKERFGHCDDYVSLSYVKILETIASKLNKRQMDSLNFLVRDESVSNLCTEELDTLNLNEQQPAHLLRYIEDRIKIDNFVLDVTPFKKEVLQLDGTQFHNLFQEGFNHANYYVQRSYEELLESIASELNEQQGRSIFELLLEGLNNKSNICSCAKVLRELVSKLSGTQLHNLFSILNEKFDDKGYEVQYLRVKILEEISSELADQLDDVLQYLKNGFSHGDDNIHNSCAKILQKISPKLNNKQLDNVLQCLSNRFKLYDDNLQNSSQKIFRIITAKLKKQPLNETLGSPEYAFKDCNIQSWILYTKIMPSISIELNEQQLDITFKLLDNRDLCIKTLQMIAFELNEIQLNNLLHYFQNKLKNGSYHAWNSYEEMLKIVLSNLNKQQTDNTFKILMKEYNDIDRRVCNLYKGILARKLNDEQLCLLIDNLSKDTESGFIASYISDDMWRRITITALKKNTKIKMGEKFFEMESLALGLLMCNPLIQFNHNDSNDDIINSEAFNELRCCYDRKFREWGFLIQKRWSNYNNLKIKLQLQQSNSDITQLKSALEHDRIGINAFNKYGQTPLHIAIHNKHWDT